MRGVLETVKQAAAKLEGRVRECTSYNDVSRLNADVEALARAAGYVAQAPTEGSAVRALVWIAGKVRADLGALPKDLNIKVFAANACIAGVAGDVVQAIGQIIKVYAYTNTQPMCRLRCHVKRLT